MTQVNRRRVLALGGAALGGAALWVSGNATAYADPAMSYGNTSTNGWPVLGEHDVELFRIEGSNLSVRLAPAAAPVLLHVARRFVYEIESQIQPGEITGYVADRRIRASYESAYLSGSGIVIRPLWYPLGAKNGFFEDQKVVIRDILADCEGLVAWGGDLQPVKESHFHITSRLTSPSYQQLVAKLRGWDVAPGKGPGTAEL